jgi:hypothetical protein
MRQMVQMKNRISGLLLETGVSHHKQRLHKVKYFRELLVANPEVPNSIRPLLKLSRETIVRLQITNCTPLEKYSRVKRGALPEPTHQTLSSPPQTNWGRHPAPSVSYLCTASVHGRNLPIVRITS